MITYPHLPLLIITPLPVHLSTMRHYPRLPGENIHDAMLQQCARQISNGAGILRLHFSQWVRCMLPKDPMLFLGAGCWGVF